MEQVARFALSDILSFDDRQLMEVAEMEDRWHNGRRRARICREHMRAFEDCLPADPLILDDGETQACLLDGHHRPVAASACGVISVACLRPAGR